MAAAVEECFRVLDDCHGRPATPSGGHERWGEYSESEGGGEKRRDGREGERKYETEEKGFVREKESERAAWGQRWNLEVNARIPPLPPPYVLSSIAV